MTATKTDEINQGLRDLGKQFGIQPAPATGASVNVGDVERWASAGGGAALVIYAVSRLPLGAIAAGILGGVLIHRAITGHCDLYESMGITTADPHESQ